MSITSESAGPPSVHGTLGYVAANSKVRFWKTPAPGEKPLGPFERETRTIDAKPTQDGNVVGVTIHDRDLVEAFARLHLRRMTMRSRRADGSPSTQPVVVTNLKDPREEKARAIDGPFTPDEYAIYQTIIDHAYDTNIGHPNPGDIIVTPTFGRRKSDLIEPNMQFLDLNDQTIDDYVEKRSITMDTFSLAALGHDVMTEDEYMADHRAHKVAITVSRVGFNKARTQAVIQYAYWCGVLCGEGLGVRLDKIDGRWLIARRISLWVS